MQKYEMTAMINGNTPDAEVPIVFDRVKKILEDSGATGIERADIGKHKLAYKTKNNQFGHYAVFVYECAPADMPIIAQKARLNKELARFVFERFISNRYKKQPVIADSPLIRASREREREERTERGERHSYNERAERIADVAVPMFAVSSSPVATKVETLSKEIDLEDIDKKLDELLRGDLTPII